MVFAINSDFLCNLPHRFPEIFHYRPKAFQRFLLIKKLGVSDKKLGVSDKKLGVSNENMGSTMESLGSPMNSWGSPTKICGSQSQMR